MQVDSEVEALRDKFTKDELLTLFQTVMWSKPRIQKLQLPSANVWLKRQGTEKPIVWRKLQRFVAKLLPYPFMRPAPILDAEGMNQREVRAAQTFASSGFPVPELIYCGPRMVLLGDVGPTVAEVLGDLRISNPTKHEELIIRSVEALGNVHAAGLCHGRPHLRDFFLQGEEIGFLDFEERPEEVMSLETAQARDLWLLFLTTSTTALDFQNTFEKAYKAWSLRAPSAAQQELRQMIAVLGRFLPIVRLIGRVRMGSDLRRFILATEFLKNALESDAAPVGAGKAGKDDRT